MKNVNYKMQVLQEQYAQDESNTSFSEFVKLTSESDPGFFRWLFDDDDLSDFDEGGHSDEWKDFLADLMNVENPYTVDDLDEFESDLSDISARIYNIVSGYSTYPEDDERSHNFDAWASYGEYNSVFLDEDGTKYYKIKEDENDDSSWIIISFDDNGMIVRH